MDDVLGVEVLDGHQKLVHKTLDMKIRDKLVGSNNLAYIRVEEVEHHEQVAKCVGVLGFQEPPKRDHVSVL